MVSLNYRSLTLALLIGMGALLSSCQLGYIAESAYYQAQLMRKRVPLQYALDHYDLTDQQRQRLELALRLREFMREELQLETRNNYSRYVHLNQRYVTYAVNAAKKDQLKSHEWNFPLIGSVPYKGFFRKKKALKEQQRLKEQNLDTYIRGVSAYSTLGWFEDPLLSSMLEMKEHHFVSTLIHETVHANLYIKSESKFNERVASFLGQLGAESYYQKLNRGEELAKLVSDETHDELIFSHFISRELRELRQWYKDNKSRPDLLLARKEVFNNIKKQFSIEVAPKLKTKNYLWFADKDLNNAFLLLLELYNSDHSVLEKLANHYNRDFKKVFKSLKGLEEEEHPEKALISLVNKLTKEEQQEK